MVLTGLYYVGNLAYEDGQMAKAAYLKLRQQYSAAQIKLMSQQTKDKYLSGGRITIISKSGTAYASQPVSGATKPISVKIGTSFQKVMPATTTTTTTSKTTALRRYFVGDKVYYNAQEAKKAYLALRTTLSAPQITELSKQTKVAVDSGTLTPPPPTKEEVQAPNILQDAADAFSALISPGFQQVTDTISAFQSTLGTTAENFAKMIESAFAPIPATPGSGASSDIGSSFSANPACPPVTVAAPPTEEETTKSIRGRTISSTIKEIPSFLKQPPILIGLLIILASAGVVAAVVGKKRNKYERRRLSY